MACHNNLRINTSYDILYSIIRIGNECPDFDEDSVIDSAMGRLLGEAKTWCRQGDSNCAGGQVCGPLFSSVTATVGKRSEEAISETHKKCLVKVTVSAEVTCECMPELEIPFPQITTPNIPGTPGTSGGQCGPDVTDWFLWEINLHTALFKGTVANEPAKLVAFGEYARRIAYKYLRFSAGACPAEPCLETVTLCGKCINVSELGNIMFGAVGKVWLNREPLIVAGGNAVSTSSTGGIDSVKDMAGVLAGLQIGHVIRQQAGAPDLKRDALCTQLQRVDNNLRNGLKKIFKDKTDQLIDGVGNNPLTAMAQRSCSECTERIPILSPHSDFSWIRRPEDMIRVKNTNWWRTYNQMTSGGIDNSRIPRTH
jgi:hypothetical protein